MRIKPDKRWLTIMLVASIVFCFLAAGSQGHANPLKGEELPLLFQGEGWNNVLEARLAQLMQRELPIADLDKEWYGMNRTMKIRLPNMPAWVDQQVLIVYQGMLFLIGTDEKLERIELLARTKDRVAVNIAKFAAYCNDAKITVWSQRPYSASELTAVVEWDGSELKIVSAKYGDPTAEYYNKMAALLEAGNIGEAMASEVRVMYPYSYSGYYKIPQLALLKAHEDALDKHRAGDPVSAAKVLKWGLDQYLGVQAGGPLSVDKLNRLLKLTEPGDQRAQAYRVDINEFISALNDYAFFLAEIGQRDEAENYLKQVLRMAPDRVVVYINLGDVCWDLGKYTEAKAYYQRYLDLLGDEKEAPQRIWDRIDGER